MSRKLLNLCLTALFGAISTAAWALSEVNGVYQISSAADWEEFAALVNGGEVNACAVLTDDIDTGIDGTMIGVADQQGKRYDGTFDGQGHTIKINLYPEAGDAGIFRYIGWRAIIQNLKVEGTITTSSKFAAGIVGRGRGIVRNCWADVVINSSVPGDATHGGIVGVGYSGTIVENCLVQTAIKGETTQNCGGVVGWAENPCNIVNCLVLNDGSAFDVSNGLSRNIARNDSRVKAIDVETYNQDTYANRPGGACYNNYVTNDWEASATTHNPAVTVVATEDLADGRICYQLNNDQSRIGWVQKIGTDLFPVPAPFGEGQVYASGATDCDGKESTPGEVLTFSNSGTTQATAHTFDMYGVCSVCGCFNFHYWEFDDPTKFDQKDRAVFLNSKEDIDVVEGMNRICNGFKLNLKMNADIEYIAEPGKYIFNPSDWIDGNFNGQGHVFTIEMSDMGDKAALFPEMAGNVENLILHGSIFTSGARAGSISGNARMALVRNVFSDIDITSDRLGDNTSGGMFGWTGGQEKHVENCIYAGTFTLPGEAGGAHCARVGGFSGWTDQKTYYTNCAVLGNIIGAGNQTIDDDTENSQNIGRNPGNVVAENVYIVNPIFGNAVSDHDKYIHYENEEGIANGELAFFLNGKQNGLERFFQVIGTDPEPMPIPKEGGIVYTSAGQFNCDGTPIGDGFSYTNNPSGEAVIPPHEFVDGWCLNCGKFDENFVTPVDGWFEVKNGAEFAWWTNYANIHKDACVRLTDDIDMSDYMERFVPVEVFAGEFDGQGHTFSNFIHETAKDYQGLIGTIVAGANIHDFVLDESCVISGNAFCGIIGGTSGSGSIYITNVGNEGTVITTNQNAAGIIGVDNGGSMDMFITNCWVTGEIIAGRESGAICGYSSGGSIVKNCWAAFTINQSGIYDCDSFTRGGAQVVNCYEADIEGVDTNKQQHYRQMGANRATITLPLEDIASGALCYNLNGKQFLDPSWYQTIGEDEQPSPYNTHGVVIGAAGKLFSIPNDDLGSVVAAVQQAEEEAAEDIVATQSLLDELDAAIEALDEVETLEEFANAVAALETVKQAVKESADAYQAYIAKCEEIKEFLASNDTFSGSKRTALEYYLSEENVDEPNNDNPLGTYEYIVDEHLATTEEIKAETERVAKWLQDAIAEDYAAGSDVSQLIPNSDFSKQNESWTGGFGNGWGETQDENGKTYYGVEAWNKTGEMYQTVEGMKPGYYLVGTHAAFRPSNKVYSTNYVAGIYANGIFNYFPAAIEDIVPDDDAVDGENCNLEGAGAHDFEVYYNEEDGVIIPDEAGDNIGFVIQGETGMAIAAKAGRYPVYTIAYVGEDGKLTIGIKNPGTNYGNDWTGWGALKVVYCGESGDAVTAAFNTVLENMNARANTILNTECGYEDADAVAIAPNFPEALRTALEAAQGKVEGAETVEAQAELAQEFSDIFQNIYAGKQAYRNLYDAYLVMDYIVGGNLELMDQDPETGEWSENGEYVFSDDETIALYDYQDALLAGYTEGTYTTEDAQNPPLDPAVAEIIPAQDEDGYYLIGSIKQFVAYRGIASDFDKYAKGKLTADIDMAGIAMLPIGHNKGENAVHIFAGAFDGQGHTLANVYLDDTKFTGMYEGDPASLFYELQSATVKNLKLTGDYYINQKFAGGLTRWMSGSSVVDNCEIAVVMHSFIDGDGTHGGVVGVASSAVTISNCLVDVTMIGEGTGPTYQCGGVCGWGNSNLKIQNTLITSQYENITKGVNGNVVGRNGYSASNVFYIQRSDPGFDTGGTLVNDEQLASGEVAWKLNGSTGDDAHWFQTLGVEAMPHLFGGDVVYYYGGQYVNDKPNPQLNAFAYNLKATQVGKNVAVRFDLNAEAEAASVSFYDGEALVCTKEAGTDLAAGTHSVNFSVDDFAGTDPSALSFKIQVTGKGSLDVLRVGDVYKVWAPYGMAVNNNPASKNFGQVMIAETWAEQYPAGYISTEKSGALFAFDQNFKPINSADGTPGFYGGLPIPQEIEDASALVVSGNYKYDMKSLRFSADGRLFVARASGTSNSSVWEINPEDLNEPWKPVFTGGELDEATGITYVGDEEQNRMAVGLAFEGAGEDLKMYVLGAQRSNGDYNFTDYNCSVYNLGTAKEWTAAPSANFEPLDGKYAYAPSHIGIHEDGQGGLWFIQSVSEASAEKPAIKHFDAEGNEDYSSTTSSIGGGRIAVTPDGQYIAIPNGSGKIVLYETNYVPMENGKIFLNPKQTVSVRESSLASFAFDWANNLYVASGGTETFSRYTVPGMNKEVVTPGFGIAKASADVNADGATDIADAVAVLNAMAGKQVAGDADVNGDGSVDIADAVAVLTIMAGN